MSAGFRILSTAAFERDSRKLTRECPDLAIRLGEAIETLARDPCNSARRHDIKKLSGVKVGKGQWRIRFRKYRLRYDVFDRDVVLHSVRHRKEAY
jgi:mRNA-degrading endonuclease RelE of RelBE toxin-antitoxin system